MDPRRAPFAGSDRIIAEPAADGFAWDARGSRSYVRLPRREGRPSSGVRRPTTCLGVLGPGVCVLMHSCTCMDAIIGAASGPFRSASAAGGLCVTQALENVSV